MLISRRTFVAYRPGVAPVFRVEMLINTLYLSFRNRKNETNKKNDNCIWTNNNGQFIKGSRANK